MSELAGSKLIFRKLRFGTSKTISQKHKCQSCDSEAPQSPVDYMMTYDYRQISNIRRTQLQNINAFRLVML